MTRRKTIGGFVPNMEAREVLTRAEMRHLHALWMDLRGPPRPCGIKHGSVSAFDTVPHLAASLQSLVQQGYGLADIGTMFGLNGQTIAHWLRQLGLKSIHRHARCRVWSAQRRRFVSVSSKRCLTRSVSQRVHDHSLIAGCKGGLASKAKLTHEQCVANGRRGAAILNAMLTPAQRSASARKARAAQMRGAA